MTKILIAVFLGGGTGSLLRYCVQMALHERIVPYSFPWATFAVNITGSFLIGLFYALSARFNLSTEVRMLLTTGLCGGFTTFSSFGYESLMLLTEGNIAAAAAYSGGSLLLGLLAAGAGVLAGKGV
mgnify:CR=1 FL=1